MSTTRPFAVLIGGAVGGVAAVLAYGVLAPTSGSEAIASVSSVSPAASVVFEPCVAPAKLEGDTCVTRVTVTKTVPVYAAAATTHKAVPVAKHATPVSKPTATATATHHEDSEHEDSEHEDSTHEDSTHEDGGSENDNH